MSGPARLLLALWATSSLGTGVSPYQLNPNSTRNDTAEHSNRAMSFYLTIGHRMKGDVPSDVEGLLYRHLGDYQVDSPQQCTLICLSTPQCRSVSYKKGKIPTCHLHDIEVDQYVMLMKDPNWDIFSTYEGSSKEWTLVFFSIAESGQPPYKIFTSPETGIWKKTACSSVHCIGTFKSSLVEHWSSLPVAKVKFVLSKGASPVVVLVFDGKGSNKMDWFSKKHLLSAKPWDDIVKEKQNYFSMEGEGKVYMRRFYINKGYGSCTGDIGWLLVRDSEDGATCGTQPQKYPQFFYSSKKTFQKRPNYSLADKMEIFVNLN